MSDNTQALKWAAIVGAVALGAYVLWKARGMAGAAVQGAAGIVTGDNPITRGATDAAGRPVTAYTGAGVVGTAGAAVNAASGGVLATVGDWLGGAAFDLQQWATGATDKPGQPDPALKSAQVRYETGGAAAATGAGNLSFSDLAGGGGYLWPGTDMPMQLQ